MTLLLDSHALLWWLEGTLHDDALAAVAEPATTVSVSAASVWEIAIKTSTGKLRSPPDLPEVVVDEGFRPLPVTLRHAHHVRDLPLHHRDPFDRVLVAQCAVEGLILVTRDHIFEAYGTPTLAC